MKLLTLKSDGIDTEVDGKKMTPFESLELKATTLRHAFLVSQEVNYDEGWYRLVFDLDRKQDLPNFADEFEVV